MYDPLEYLNDPNKPKYDEALDPLDPRKLKYIPPPPPRLAQEPPPVEAPPQMPAQSASPQMPAWRTADDARESTRAAMNADEELKQTIANRPQLQPAKGWKGALQTVGEMFLNPAVIHPKYTRQMNEYGQDVGAAEARAKIAANQAEQQRRQAQAEAQGGLWARQGETEDRKQAQIDYEMRHPKQPAPTVLSPGARAIDPLTGRVIGEGGPMKPMAPTREEMDEAATARRMKEANQMGLKGPDRINYIAGKNVIRPPKVGGAGSGDERGKPGQFQMAERVKASRLAAAEEEAAKETAELTAGLTNPYQKKGPDGKIAIDYTLLEPAKKEIQDRLNKKKEQIQESYLQEIVNLGGSITQERAPVLQGVGQAPPKPPAPPKPAAGQKLLPEFKSSSGHVFRAGQRAKTKDGKEAIIKGFNPDGSVVFE
jgi:hypothetical protein